MNTPIKAKECWNFPLPEMEAAQKAFYDVRVTHPKLEGVISDLSPLLMPHSESNIVCIVGATGTGKTTLGKFALQRLFEGYAGLIQSDVSAIPVVHVEAQAPVKQKQKQGLEGLFRDLQSKLQDPAPGRKSFLEERDGRMTLNSTGTEDDRLLESVRNLLTYRQTRVWVIDEAYQLLKLADYESVMDVLKSLSNTTQTKIVLIGSFDLYSLVGGHAQVARRSNIINFDRYHIDNPHDGAAFREIIELLQAKWPCTEVPQFVDIWDSLLELTLGCVGLLKSFLLDASAHQLTNHGVWKPEFLQKAAKSIALRNVIKAEIDQGEAMLHEAVYGQSLFDDKKVRELSRRMGAAR